VPASSGEGQVPYGRTVTAPILAESGTGG
jgi:hypothetical protein